MEYCIINLGQIDSMKLHIREHSMNGSGGEVNAWGARDWTSWAGHMTGMIPICLPLLLFIRQGVGVYAWTERASNA